MRTQPRKQHDAYADVHRPGEDYRPHGDGGKVNVVGIGNDEADVGRKEAQSADGKPLDALGDEQHIAEPARDYCGDDDRERGLNAAKVPAQEGKQQEGLCDASKRFVAL